MLPFGCTCYVNLMLRVRMGWGGVGHVNVRLHLLRVHVGLGTKLDLCQTGSVLAPLGGAPVKSGQVAHMSDAKSSCIVSKMLRNHRFASAKL